MSNLSHLSLSHVPFTPLFPLSTITCRPQKEHPTRHFRSVLPRRLWVHAPQQFVVKERPTEREKRKEKKRQETTSPPCPPGCPPPPPGGWTRCPGASPAPASSPPTYAATTPTSPSSSARRTRRRRPASSSWWPGWASAPMSWSCSSSWLGGASGGKVLSRVGKVRRRGEREREKRATDIVSVHLTQSSSSRLDRVWLTSSKKKKIIMSDHFNSRGGLTKCYKPYVFSPSLSLSLSPLSWMSTFNHHKHVFL